MKTKLIMAVPMVCFLLMSIKDFPPNSSEFYANVQDSQIIGVYDGNEGYGYNFITQHKDGGSEFTMTFKNVDDAVMKEYDLDEELFLNQKFEVTYSVKTVVTKDEDGFDDEEDVLTITKLKAL